MTRGARPLLFVDIDGVLNPYAGACPDGFVEHELFAGEEPLRLCAQHGQWLDDLSRHFDLVWATGWSEADRAALATVLDLPGFVGTAVMPPVPFEPSLKVPAVAGYAADRAAAWIDDVMTPEASAWAAGRSAPTLLVAVDPRVGLTAEQVRELVEWAGHRT